MLKLSFESISSSNQWACLIRARFLKQNLSILHYVKSSIRLGLRPFMKTVQDSTVWCLGDGARINLYKDKWLPESIINKLEVPANLHKSLRGTVKDFIVEKCWCFPYEFATRYPLLIEEIRKIIIIVSAITDQLVWNDSNCGDLTFKAAFMSISHHHSTLSWTKNIWRPCIPHSRSWSRGGYSIIRCQLMKS